MMEKFHKDKNGFVICNTCGSPSVIGETETGCLCGICGALEVPEWRKLLPVKETASEAIKLLVGMPTELRRAKRRTVSACRLLECAEIFIEANQWALK